MPTHTHTHRVPSFVCGHVVPGAFTVGTSPQRGRCVAFESKYHRIEMVNWYGRESWVTFERNVHYWYPVKKWWRCPISHDPSPQEGALSRGTAGLPVIIDIPRLWYRHKRARYHAESAITGRLSCNCWSVWKHEGQFLDHQTGLPLLPKRDNAESCQYYPYPDPNIMIIKWTDCPYECNERNNDPFISSFNLCLYSSLLLIFFMCGVRVTYNIETTK